MSYLTDNGIDYGSDQYIAQPGYVPGLIKNFKKPVIRPEELARAEQYGISVNVPCTNTRNSEIIADDRYGHQTGFDMDDNTYNGLLYERPAQFYNKKISHHYNDVIPQRRRDQGTAYNTMMPVKHCVKGRYKVKQGQEPVPYLDEDSAYKWQRCNDGWNGVYPLQERFGMPNPSLTLTNEQLLMLVFLIIVIVMSVYNIIKMRDIAELIKSSGLNR